MADKPVIQHCVTHTGQHYDYNMDKLLFQQLQIPAPQYNLAVGSGSHGSQLGAMLQGLEPILLKERPDWVVVYGDTNSTLAGATIAARLGFPLAHVEAGCRSYRFSMPEEQNRIVADHLSQLLLCPSHRSVEALHREGVGTDDDPRHRRVVFVGDIMYEALLANSPLAEKDAADILKRLRIKSGEYYLLTLHRAENTDNADRLRSLLSALATQPRPVIFPVHPRTRCLISNFAERDRVRIIEPLGYLEMLAVEKNACKILTDSGGVQKEALYVRVPCITLRDETEWPETVECGANQLVGIQPEKLLRALDRSNSGVVSDAEPFGDGHSSRYILDELLNRTERRACLPTSHPCSKQEVFSVSPELSKETN